ncbi:MAG: hypothetical protein P1U34_11850 [Coxiellaceae bacterium]|nr:hypothetical protein [Coxiellaceae bacterium]
MKKTLDGLNRLSSLLANRPLTEEQGLKVKSLLSKLTDSEKYSPISEDEKQVCTTVCSALLGDAIAHNDVKLLKRLARIPDFTPASQNQLSAAEVAISKVADARNADEKSIAVAMFRQVLAAFTFKGVENGKKENLLMTCIRKGLDAQLTIHCAESEKIDVNSFNAKGKTALMSAASRGQDAVITYLLDNGAKNYKTPRGKTASDYYKGEDVTVAGRLVLADPITFPVAARAAVVAAYLMPKSEVTLADSAVEEKKPNSTPVKSTAPESPLASAGSTVGTDKRPAHQVSPKTDKTAAARRRSSTAVGAARKLTIQGEFGGRPASAGSPGRAGLFKPASGSAPSTPRTPSPKKGMAHAAVGPVTPTTTITAKEKANSPLVNGTPEPPQGKRHVATEMTPPRAGSPGV